MSKIILADGRWQGLNGIGRFTHEVLTRLKDIDTLKKGPEPLSLHNLVWQPYHLYKNRHRYKLFFSPGFNPTICSSIPFAFTIHDLIHLHYSDRFSFFKKNYYEKFIKPCIPRAFKIFTVSHFSKQAILEWCPVEPDHIQVVGNGISDEFQLEGEKYQPEFPYFLHVGNHKPHKNIHRLIEAFSTAKIDSSIRLILTHAPNKTLLTFIHSKKLMPRIVFNPGLSPMQLSQYYRGALAVVLPSLYEGFGLPVLEGMACGTPVIASNTTSIPEVAGNAAWFIDPHRTDSITDAFEKIVFDKELRKDLIDKGVNRAKEFSWERTAGLVEKVLRII